MQEILGGQLTAWRQWHPGADRQVLALHCSLAHAGAWSGLATRLPGLAITAPDLPGHGHSAPWPGGEGLHDASTLMGHALLDRLVAAQGGPVELIGHSFGATVALRLALEAPQQIRRLVLIEPVLFCIARDAPEFAGFADNYIAVNQLIDHAPDRAAALFHGAWGEGDFATLPEAQRRYMAARMDLIRAQNEVLLQDGPGLITPGRLEAFAAPVLLVEGTASPPVIGVIQQRLAARLPQARREVVAAAGHMLPITHPAAVAALIGAG